eukprot:GHVU01019526.1.p2 GENE.GHVU01019526.1~~GHVU01019526.1.p2  ORF type:complete len:210 (-),score=26.47 GHVU01019526.1:58-621(-)
MFSATRLSVLVCLALGFAVNAAPSGANVQASNGDLAINAELQLLASLLSASANANVDKRQFLGSFGLGSNFDGGDFDLNAILSEFGLDADLGVVVTTSGSAVIVSATATATDTATDSATATATATDATGTISLATAVTTGATATSTANVNSEINNILNSFGLGNLFSGNTGANADVGAGLNLGNFGL